MTEAKSQPVKSCAICGKPRVRQFSPFCSPRCADVDLGRWLKGGYVIPGRAEDETSDEEDRPSIGLTGEDGR